MLSICPAVILAAGRSTRMGRAKATLPLDNGDTFVTRIIRTFRTAGVDDVVVVLGHEAEAIAAAIDASGLSARMVINPHYDRGQLSSLQTGLAVIDRPGVSGMLMTLVDVPLVTASTVRAVLARYRQSRAPIVRPVERVESVENRGTAHATRHGHPILIDRSLFNALRSASDTSGAKPVVRAHASPAGDVPVDDEGAFRDIDTLEEYERLSRRGADADPRRAPSHS